MAIGADLHSSGRSGVTRSGNVPIDRATLFAGHAECPKCRAFVRWVARVGAPSPIGELVEGWCGVCGTSTFFLLPL